MAVRYLKESNEGRKYNLANDGEYSTVRQSWENAGFYDDDTFADEMADDEEAISLIPGATIDNCYFIVPDDLDDYDDYNAFMDEVRMKSKKVKSFMINGLEGTTLFKTPDGYLFVELGDGIGSLVLPKDTFRRYCK